MRRSAIAAGVGVLVVLAGGLGLLAWRASLGKEVDAVRLGILADHSIGSLDAGREVCQRAIDLDRPITFVGLAVDTGGGPGPPLTVRIRDLVTQRTLREVKVPAGFVNVPPNYYGAQLSTPLSGGRTVEVCAHNDGKRSLGLIGDESNMAQGAIQDDGVPFDGDWAVYFPLSEADRRTHLQMVPDMVRRASVLRPNIVTPAFYAVLAAVLLGLCPAALWWAAARSARADDEALSAAGRDDRPT
jgi:hypothetical protein